MCIRLIFWLIDWSDRKILDDKISSLYMTCCDIYYKWKKVVKIVQQNKLFVLGHIKIKSINKDRNHRKNNRKDCEHIAVKSTYYKNSYIASFLFCKSRYGQDPRTYHIFG